MPMSKTTRKEMLPRMRERYLRRGKKGKKVMIDDLCDQCNYSRKHAIKLLNAKAGWGGDPQKRKGRPPRYGKDTEKIVLKLWQVSEQTCGKRLKAMVPLWLPYYEKMYGQLKESIQEQVLSISAAQIDRILSPHKVMKGRCGTKPGSILKTQIPIRTDNWDATQPGFLEADTVAHCGGSLAGDHIWSVTYTDIFSGWTVNRGVWNKGADGIVKATQSMEELLPFEILGFDCDNGSEFLNQHLIRYLQNRPIPIQFTRSRPYHSNDNAHVEQKNWTHVRQLFGYHRIEDKTLLDQMNALYKNESSLLHNYFYPATKLIDKHRIQSKIKKIHDKPQTPYQRLMASEHINAKQKERLTDIYKKLNPFELKKTQEIKLKNIFLQIDLHSRGRNIAI